MALDVNCTGSVGVARGKLVPFGRAIPPRSSEVRFTMGDQGCAASQGQQDLLDLDGHQPQTAIVTYGVCKSTGLHRI